MRMCERQRERKKDWAGTVTRYWRWQHLTEAAVDKHTLDKQQTGNKSTEKMNIAAAARQTPAVRLFMTTPSFSTPYSRPPPHLTREKWRITLPNLIFKDLLPRTAGDRTGKDG